MRSGFVPLHKNKLNMEENIRCRHDVKGLSILYNLNQTGDAIHGGYEAAIDIV